MKLWFLSILILLVPQPVLSEELPQTEWIEVHQTDKYMFTKVMCVRGYEFVVLCGLDSKRRCDGSKNFQFRQILNESGGGVPCE